jgi:hypothetical protein
VLEIEGGGATHTHVPFGFDAIPPSFAFVVTDWVGRPREDGTDAKEAELSRPETWPVVDR